MRIIAIGTKKNDIWDVEISDENTLETLQCLVEGYIELATPLILKKEGIELIVNEEGLISLLPVNKNLFATKDGLFIFGNAVIVGAGDEDFTGLTEDQVQFVKQWLDSKK